MEKILQPAATKISCDLLDALRASNARFAHWKSNCRLELSLKGQTDLDLLIDPNDKPAFYAAMQKLSCKRLISPPWNLYPEVEDWLAFDYETGALLHIHAHFVIITGIRYVKHLQLPWTHLFFKHVIEDPETGWPIPKPELEALLLFIRIWAKMPPFIRLSPKIPAYLVNELRDLLKTCHLPALMELLDELKLKAPVNFQDKLLRIVNNGSEKEIVEIAQPLYRQLKPYYRKSWIASLGTSLFYHLVLKFKKSARIIFRPLTLKKKIYPTGKAIAFIGIDGSGKSSICNDVLSWLTFKIDTHYCYLGKYPYFKSYNKKLYTVSGLLLSWKYLLELFRKITGSYYFIYLIRKKLTLLRTARKLSMSGSVVIYDRFPQYSIPGMNDGMKLQAENIWYASFEKEAFGKISGLEPDMVFVLKVTPEVAYLRKPAHKIDFIKKKHQNLLDVRFESAKTFEINSDLPYSEVLLKVKRLIWENL